MKKNRGFKSFNSAISRYVDCDYVDNLGDSEKEYLEKFLREYYQHDFSNDPINNHPDAYKEACNRENAARRDIMNRNTKVPVVNIENLNTGENPVRRKRRKYND